MEEAKELHRSTIQKFVKRRILTLGIDNLWAADLLIMSEYAKENNGYKYLLVVIDTFSKYGFGEPVKTKTGKVVAEAFEKIMKKSRRHPQLLHVDMGSEFVNSTFQNMLKKHGIKMYHTYSEEKSAICERFNRTLNHKFRLYFEVNKDHKWVRVLKSVLDEYNNQDKHRTIGMRPCEVNIQNEEEVFERMFPLSDFKLQKPLFKPGDRVRITCKQRLFRNKYKQNWSREIFIINKIHYTDPITYSIKDLYGEEILGKFYNLELQKTKC